MPLANMPPPMDATSALVQPAEGQYSAAWWRPRIEESLKHARTVVRPADERYRTSIGPYYRDGWGGNEHHCGDYWKITTDLKPALVSGDLQFQVSSRSPETTQSPDGTIDHAEALEHWLNRTVVDTGLTDTLDEIAENMMWSAGCAMLELEEIPGSTSTYWKMQGQQMTRLRPKISSIDPARLLIDHSGDLKRARFIGHWEVYHMADILAEVQGKTDSAGWNLDAIHEVLSTNSGDDAKLRNQSLQDRITNAELTRWQFVCYRIWCKDTNMIHTIAYSAIRDEQLGREIRQPAKWTGHPRGPYVIFGIVWVRNNPWPQSLTSIAERSVRMNDQTRKKIKDDSAAYKRNVMMQGQRALKAYKKATNGEGINGDATKIKEIITGGVQEKTLEHIQFMNSDIETMFGLSQVRQGNVSDPSTATANAIAESAASVRRKYFGHRFRCCLRELGVRLAHFGWNQERIETTIPVADPRTGESIPMDYFGGVAQDDPQEWEDVEADIDIEPFSSDGTDVAARQRSMELVGVILQEFTVLVMNNPLGAMIVNWENWLDDRMQAANVKGGGRRYINYQVVKALLRMQIMSMMTGAGPMGQAPGIGSAPTPQPGRGVGAGKAPGGPQSSTGQSVGGSAGQEAKGFARQHSGA